MAQLEHTPNMEIWDNIDCSTIIWFLSLYYRDILPDVEKYVQNEINSVFFEEYCKTEDEEEEEKKVGKSKFKFKFNHIKIYIQGIILDFTLINIISSVKYDLHLTIKNKSPPLEDIKPGNTQSHIRFNRINRKEPIPSKDEIIIKFNYEIPVGINKSTKIKPCSIYSNYIDITELNLFINSCLFPGINFLFSIFSLNDIIQDSKTNEMSEELLKDDRLLKYINFLQKSELSVIDKKLLQKNTIDFHSDFLMNKKYLVEITFHNKETVNKLHNLQISLNVLNENIRKKKEQKSLPSLKSTDSKEYPPLPPLVKTPSTNAPLANSPWRTSNQTNQTHQTDTNYKEKYLKYKQKYIQLKNKLK